MAASAAAWASVTIAANLLEAPELALATALGLALAGLGAGPEKARRGLLTALGALAGFQVLVEVNVGLVTALLAVLAVAGSTDRWRPGAVRAGAAFLIVTVVALVAAGQSLGNFVSYLHGAFAVAVGYGSAMGLSAGRRAEDWYALIDAALLVLIFVLALRGSPLRRQVAVTLMLALWGWETLKEGFVRHDLHDLTFFGLFLVALALARLPRRYVPAQAVSIALASLLACLANGGVPPSLRSPVEDVKAFYAEVADLSSAARWSRVQAIARYQVRATGDALHPGMVASLAGLTLAAEPWDDAVTFGYPQLRWRPEPVLQSYSAYTPYLDGLDASLPGVAGRPPAHPLPARGPRRPGPLLGPAQRHGGHVLPLPSALRERPLAGAGPGALTAAARSRWWAAPAPASANPSTSPSSPATSSWLRSRSAHRSWPGPKAFSSSRPRCE